MQLSDSAIQPNCITSFSGEWQWVYLSNPSYSFILKWQLIEPTLNL